MKRFGLVLLISVFMILPAYADYNPLENIFSKSGSGTFTYHIPDSDETKDTKTSSEPAKTKTENKDIVSDDITADTSKENTEENETANEEEINVASNSTETSDDDENYGLDDMYSYILKGSVQYDEDEENAVPLELKDNQYLALKINKPTAVKEQYFGNLQSSDSLFYSPAYSMHNGSEYSIKPMSSEASKTVGGWSAGTTYNQGIDYGELEQSSGIYSKYQYKNFAISTSFAKTINSTNNDYNNNFYLSPEFAINQYFKIKSYISVDTAKKRKKAEVSLSFNPFGNKDTDRFNFEVGANETYDEVNNTFKNQFKFSTNFKF